MALLLSPKGRITVEIALDFYYRRIRRIMPTYLIVIMLTLGMATQVVDDLRRLEIIREARASLYLYSNLQPLFEKATYFQMVSFEWLHWV